MVNLRSHLTTMNLHDKRIFVRADLNIPLDNHGTVLDDYRLKKILPTIDYILSQGGTIILATHLGRPKKQEESLSTKNLLPWFEQRNYNILFEADLKKAAMLSRSLQPRQLLLLENMRFFEGEQHHDPTFANQLAACADIYVNDAFGLLHRQDTSITLLPQLFTTNKRTIGFLIEHELQKLNNLLINPPQPCMLILGGGKVADKIPLIEHMLGKIKFLVLCPAIVFTFLKARGTQIGKSLVDNDSIELCKNILDEARQHSVTVLMPQDYQIALDTFNGPLSYATAEEFPTNGVGISIGNKTIAFFEHYIKQAGTIFYNGAMGTLQRPETLEGMHQLLTCIANSNAFTVIGGGDSAAVAQHYNLTHYFDHVSTGGGATLAYLSGKELPGLKPFLA